MWRSKRVVLARFLPRDEQFFIFFAEAAGNAAEAATLLREIVAEGATDELKIQRLQQLEDGGDEITHKIFSALNSTFVTPIDRDDIHALASELDDFIDGLNDAGQRLGRYGLGRPTETVCALTQILIEQADHLAHVMPLLDAMNKHRDEVHRDIKELHRLENEADRVYGMAQARLYDGIAEVPQLIHAMRWGEIHSVLEETIDQAERVANTLEGMLLKYA